MVLGILPGPRWCSWGDIEPTRACLPTLRSRCLPEMLPEVSTPRVCPFHLCVLWFGSIWTVALYRFSHTSGLCYHGTFSFLSSLLNLGLLHAGTPSFSSSLRTHCLNAVCSCSQIDDQLMKQVSSRQSCKACCESAAEENSTL